MSWIWSYKAETLGVEVDPRTGSLTWFASVGNLCGDDEGFATQTPVTFEQYGPPARVGPLPDNVVIGLRRALDEVFMRRCLELARLSAEAGETAVGSLVVRQGAVVGEFEARTFRA